MGTSGAPPRSRLLTRLLLAFWVALAAGWLLSVFLGRGCSRQRDCGPCPGPVPQPAPRSEPWCVKFAEKLRTEVAKLDDQQGVDVVFYGDSITETWRGSDMGRPCARCKGCPRVFQDHFGARYSTEVLAVGGDQVAHLQWRLAHGQLFLRHPPRAVVLMIGTNDLGAASCGGRAGVSRAANGTLSRIEQTLRVLRAKNPSSRILALGILPRGGATPATGFQWPNLYTRAIQEINSGLEGLAKGDDMVTFLDCGKALMPDGKLHPELMPDALHPNAAGMELFAACIDPVLQSLVGPEMGGWKPLGGPLRGLRSSSGSAPPASWVRRRLWPDDLERGPG